MTTKIIKSIDEITITTSEVIGGRNKAAHKMANAYKQDGQTKEQAQQRLSRWNQKNTQPLPEYELISIIHNIYNT